MGLRVIGRWQDSEPHLTDGDVVAARALDDRPVIVHVQDVDGQKVVSVARGGAIIQSPHLWTHSTQSGKDAHMQTYTHTYKHTPIDTTTS